MSLAVIFQSFAYPLVLHSANRERPQNFWQGSLNVMNKHYSSNINIMFIRSCLVFNNVLKILAQQYNFYIIYGTFF